MGAWTPPQEFDGYVLFRLLGRGGMGEVHLASDALLDRQVAIKFISAAQVDREARQRFLVEARAVARLQHPNVVAIHRIGLVQGYPYLVSEFVDGQPLGKLLGKLSGEQIRSVALDLAGALACAHGQGILHRDIKPANVIMNREGRAKLLDFGIAKFVQGAGPLPELGGPGLPGPAGAAEGGEEDEDATPAGVRPQGLEDEDATPAGVRPQGLEDQADPLRLTQPGTLMGSPRYMAPELWLGREASFASDVYAFGAMIHALCAGQPPFREKELSRLRERVLGEEAPRLEGVDSGLADVVERCLRGDPARRYRDGKELRAALAALGRRAGTLDPEGNPYRGLYAFEAEHGALFFGRDSETRMILEKLKREPAVLVVGDSGVGKSSLCRAAILPRAGQWLDEGRTWTCLTMMPGQRPMERLAGLLGEELGLERGELARGLMEDPLGISRKVSGRLGQDRGLVLFIDQLEEILTGCAPEQKEAALQMLAWLLQPIPGLRLLASLRGDHLVRLASLPAFDSDLSRALYFLRPLSAERLREAITGPAKAHGVRFESAELVDELVEATERAEGGLPLLQFALAELWEARRDAPIIDRRALARIGGVAGALSRHADQVLDGLMPAERSEARGLLLRLVNADGTRARRVSDDLGLDQELRARTMDRLVRGRLVVASQTEEGRSYSIAHEALAQGWGRLGRWLAENVEAKRLSERLRLAAAEWSRLDRAASLLWRGPQLKEARDLKRDALGGLERDFLDRSLSASRRGRLWRWGLGLGLPLLILGILLAMHLVQRAEARRQVDAKLRLGLSLMEEVEAQRPGLAEERRRIHGMFDRGELDAAERAWDGLRAGEQRLFAKASKASGLLESTSWLDRERADLRRALARSLVLLARLSAEAGRRERRDAFLGRLQAMDALPPGMSPGAPLRPPLGEARPEGGQDQAMIRIPAGAFYFGSGADDAQRREFFHAVPIHRVDTGAYRIARHETTFADWIGFLEALPKDERARYTPSLGKGGFAGALGLRRGKSGRWQLRFKPGKRTFQVSEGQRIVYPDRERRAEQDWLRMPVVGIRLSDAERYCRWLDESGRLPGARPCTELEWERAARGTDDRDFPHGRVLKPHEANFDETYGKRSEAMGPDEVGSYPASASPFGALDMAGNVWELCRSSFEQGQVVARGGSYYFGLNSSRLTDREVVEPAFRDVSVGFRVCADVPWKGVK